MKILSLASVGVFASLGVIANAQDSGSNPFARNDTRPNWATPLPFQTLSCTEKNSFGVESKSGGYQGARYPLKTYTISRLTPNQMKENSNFCRNEERQGSILNTDIYIYEACYRFDGALNGLRAAQGWCTEMYRKGRPTNVTCDFNQPKLSFTPAGEFMAFGQRLNFTNPEEPLVAAAFTSLGSCTGWSIKDPKPLVNFK